MFPQVLGAMPGTSPPASFSEFKTPTRQGSSYVFDFDLKGSKPANFLNSILVKIGSDSEYSDDNLEELNQIEKTETIESKSKPNAMKNSLSFATTQTVKNAPKKKSIPINPPIIRTLCSYRDFQKEFHHGVAI